jgi:hypothetical protein
LAPFKWLLEFPFLAVVDEPLRGAIKISMHFVGRLKMLIRVLHLAFDCFQVRSGQTRLRRQWSSLFFLRDRGVASHQIKVSRREEAAEKTEVSRYHIFYTSRDRFFHKESNRLYDFRNILR